MFRKTSCFGALKVLMCAVLTAAALTTGATSARAYGPCFFVPRPIVVNSQGKESSWRSSLPVRASFCWQLADQTARIALKHG
jgi:hypothetical protein